MLKVNKRPLRWYMGHSKDALPYLGYKYHGNVYKNTISPELYNSNTMVKNFINLLERHINFLIDSVKNIKLQYFIAKDKNDINFN